MPTIWILDGLRGNPRQLSLSPSLFRPPIRSSRPQRSPCREQTFCFTQLSSLLSRSILPISSKFYCPNDSVSESAKQRMSFVKLSIFGTSFEVRSFFCSKSVGRGLIGCWVCRIGWEGYDSICRPSTCRNGYVFLLAKSRSPLRSSLGELEDCTLTVIDF